jgi:hypothetical protein
MTDGLSAQTRKTPTCGVTPTYNLGQCQWAIEQISPASLYHRPHLRRKAEDTCMEAVDFSPVSRRHHFHPERTTAPLKQQRAPIILIPSQPARSQPGTEYPTELEGAELAKKHNANLH